MKLAINRCFGGFGLSDEARNRFFKAKESKGHKITSKPDRDYPDRIYYYIDEECIFDSEIPRDDPDLIKIIEEMGENANGDHARLKIVEIPDDVKYQITEYDGVEKIEEVHRIWK